MLEAYTLSQSYDRLLEEHKALQSQLTEKDATIKELQQQIGAYKSLTPNAWENAQELDNLRKALEEAYTAMTDALQVMEMEKRDFNLMPQCTIKDAAEEMEKLLYPVGEGDKE